MPQPGCISATIVRAAGALGGAGAAVVAARATAGNAAAVTTVAATVTSLTAIREDPRRGGRNLASLLNTMHLPGETSVWGGRVEALRITEARVSGHWSPRIQPSAGN